jgi:hypothetical protein
MKDAGMDTTGTDETQSTDTEVKIPEYWNAENTSQRIVDFATSFFDAFKGKGEEFLSKIKAAVEEGFKQAKDILGGNLPDVASKLVNDTHDLVMAKFDKWAQEKGITPKSDSTEQALAA